MIMAGGKGERLHPLTQHRAKPAVLFGGQYRIIDFTLSNCLNSNLRKIAVLIQYKSHSLDRHIRSGWNVLNPELGEFLFSVPPQQRISEDWYRGTADAVYQNLFLVDAEKPEHLLVLAGDHVYKMDYEIMLRQHVDTGADVTVGCLEVPRMDATAFGVMHVDGRDRIIDFVEKPKDPPGIPDKPDLALASMGIYVFETQFLMDQLRRDAATEGSSRDFGKDIIPYIVKNGSAWAHRFNRSCVRSSNEDVAYWRDVGTIDAYWEANVDLTDVLPQLDLYDRDWPIRTFQPQDLPERLPGLVPLAGRGLGPGHVDQGVAAADLMFDPGGEPGRPGPWKGRAGLARLPCCVTRRALSSRRLSATRRDPAAAPPRSCLRGRARKWPWRTSARTRTSTSGPLISFGSRPAPQPTPSFWNEPTTNALSGSPSPARAAARCSGPPSGKFSRSIPSGILKTRSGGTPAERTSSSISPCVTCTRAIWSALARSFAKAASNSGIPGVPGRPCMYASPIRFGESRQRAASPSKWLVWKTDCPATAAAHVAGPTS